MNAGAFLAAAETLPYRDITALTNGGGLVVVAPHPDDESLGCGGLIAEARSSGIAVQLIVLSDGVGSHRNSNLYPPSRLQAVREAETIEAVGALGLDKSCIRFLRLPDAFVPTTGTLATIAQDAIRAAVVACHAGAICVTWRHDPHCDHRAAAELVDAVRSRVGATNVFAYPIWGWALPPETDVGAPPRGLRLDIGPHLNAKRAAIHAHRSQTTDLISDDPHGFRLDPTMIERFARPFEIFLQTDPMSAP